MLGRVSRYDDASLAVPGNGVGETLNSLSKTSSNADITVPPVPEVTTASTQTNREPQSAEVILGDVTASEDTPFALGISLDQQTIEGLVDVKYMITAPLGTKIIYRRSRISPSTPGGMYTIDAADISKLTALAPQGL